MGLPTFLGIGAQRAATTWLYHCLKEHPDVFMPDVKEIHFFDEKYSEGIDWYKSFFPEAAGCQAMGEITPNYLNSENAIPRMAKHLPEVRLIIILRAPIERAYSAYKLLNERYKDMSFKQACEANDYFIRLSCYAESLKRVFNFYPAENVKIFLYEDVKNKPLDLITELYGFLGVDCNYTPKSVTQVYNAIILPNVQNAVSALKMDWLLNSFKRSALGKCIKNKIVDHQKQNKRVADKDYRNYLIDYFSKDVEEVQMIIGRDLSHWLK